MFRQIKESDWKLFRRLHKVALQRFCRRVIEEINRTTAKCDGEYHQCYLKVFRLIEKRDKELGLAFDDPRRSTALIQLANVRGSDLLTEEEFSQFSPETRESVEVILGIRRR